MRIPYGPFELSLPLEKILGPPAVRWPGPSKPSGAEDDILRAMGEGRSVVSEATRALPWDLLLRDLPSAAEQPVVVVPDATRRGVWQDLLPDLLGDMLERWPASPLTVIVASGVHAPADDLSLRAHLRLDAPSRETITRQRVAQALESGRLLLTQHRAEAHLETVGETASGTVVALNPVYVRSDARILVGGTSYHYFAGFGGGPKLIFPGLGGRLGIVHNHLLSISDVGWNATCAPAVREGNPVATDIAEAASFVPPHAMVFALGLGDGRCLTSVWDRAGWLEGFFRGCDLYRSLHEVPLDAPLQGVVADAGGEPRDRHLLQVHKSLQHASRFVEPGGWILLIGACRDGEGSPSLVDFAARLRRESFADLKPSAGASLHLQTAVALRDATDRRRVGFLSQLCRTNPHRVRALGWEPLADEDAATDWLKAFQGSRWGRLEEADTVLPRL